MESWKIDLRLAVIPAVFGLGCLVGSLFPRSQAVAEEKGGKYALCYAQCMVADNLGKEGSPLKVEKRLFRINTETGDVQLYTPMVTWKGGTYSPHYWSDPVENKFSLRK